MRKFIASLVAAAVLVGASPGWADLVVEDAEVIYNPGASAWTFSTNTAAGSILVADRKMAKILAKLSKGGPNFCLMEYAPDSRIAASNGNFYAVFKISKCL